MVLQYTDPLFQVYCCFVAALFGAAMGSFLNCAAWRIAHGESFLRGRSHCPACGHTLGVLDLIPVVSYLALRGKCRYCGSKVSARYVLTELAFAVLTVLCVLRFGLTVVCFRNYIFFCCLFCLSLVDLEIYEIPDGCLILSALAWFAAIPWYDTMGWKQTLWRIAFGVLLGGGMLALSLVMDHILKRESLGGGDIKLFVLVGLYLGAIGSLFAVLLSCIVGILFALAGRRGRGEPFPFGPAIAASTAFMLLFGTPLVLWYADLLNL